MHQRRRTTTDAPPAREHTLLPSARAVLAAASHEIRAPLHTILGMSELLARTSLTPAQGQYLDALRRAATSLTSLLDSLLDVKRQRDDLRLERLWLPDVIEAAVATVRDRAAAAGMPLSVEVDPAVPRRLRGDAVRVQQVLINLLTNAVKYGERGVVTLRVGLDSVLHDEDTVVPVSIEVRDEGAGIASDRRADIFVAGTRLEHHSTIEGHGLGLAITKVIVDELGGRIELDSRARGEVPEGTATGTTFRVVLPMARAGSTDTTDGQAVAIRGVRFLVAGSAQLEASVRQALAPWSPFIERVDVDNAVGRWQALEQSSAPAHVVVVEGDHLAAVRAITLGRVIVAVPSASLSQIGNEIERARATPILLPITTGNLYGAVDRVLRRLKRNEPGSRDIDLAGAVVHAADDDADARLLIELFLRDTAVTLHLHETTDALIDAVDHDPTTTLVLCDVEMPDGGARVAHAALASRSGVSFVAITAHGDDVINGLRAAGFLEVVRKPLTRRGLIDLVARRGVPRRTAVPHPVTLPATSTPSSSQTASLPMTRTPMPRGEGDALQLEARMALARRDYRALQLLGRRLPTPFRERLEEAARAKNDAEVREVLRQLEDGPPTVQTVDDAIRALLPDYLERRAADANDIAEALVAGRFDHIAFVGHRLAGTARAFGMDALSDVGTALERAGHRRAGDEVTRLLQHMHRLLHEVPL
jgi:nitrogen-specific signal transduction histidine kinase/CheY-like chemotaxis protein/HPt (histidine-containing phosphotransfer) domain-containing protein